MKQKGVIKVPKIVTPHIDDLDIEIRSTIGSVVYALEINQADLAKRIGLTPTTLTARMKCPGTFRAEELRRIAEVAKRGGYNAEFRI